MSSLIDRILLILLDLTEVDEMNIRESDGPWDPQTEQFIPSDRPLHQILRSMIEYSVALGKPQIQTAEKA